MSRAEELERRLAAEAHARAVADADARAGREWGARLMQDHQLVLDGMNSELERLEEAMREKQRKNLGAERRPRPEERGEGHPGRHSEDRKGGRVPNKQGGPTRDLPPPRVTLAQIVTGDDRNVRALHRRLVRGEPAVVVRRWGAFARMLVEADVPKVRKGGEALVVVGLDPDEDYEFDPITEEHAEGALAGIMEVVAKEAPRGSVWSVEPTEFPGGGAEDDEAWDEEEDDEDWDEDDEDDEDWNDEDDEEDESESPRVVLAVRIVRRGAPPQAK